MSKYKNLSDGKSDGIVIFYMKHGKLKPIVLTQEQADMSDLMEIGLEYILDNKKPRFYPVDNFMYFLIKDKKVVYIGFGNSIDSVMQENKDYDSYCTIKDNFKDKERMKVLIDNLKLYKPKII